MPELKVPFRFVDLPEPGRSQLYRNFEEIQRKLDAHTHPAEEVGLPAHTHPAEEVTAGTFGAGNWVFDPVTQFIKIGRGYFGMHPVHGVNQTAASNWAAFGHWDKQGSLDYAFMQNAEGRTLVNTSSGQSIGLRVAGADTASVDATKFRFGNTWVGTYPWDTSWAHFGASQAWNAAANYAFMNNPNGETLVNSWNGQLVALRRSGVNELWVDSAGTKSRGWLRSQTTAQGWYHEAHGGGIYMTDSTWVQVYNGKGLYVLNEIRAMNDAMMHRWNGSSNHGIHGHQAAGWGTGWMVRGDGAMWVMCPGTQTWRMAGGDIMSIWNSGGWADLRANVPTLGGTAMVITGVNQFGRSSSSRRYKTVLGDLEQAIDLGINQPVDKHPNPVWKMRPLRYLWNENVQNYRDINPLFPKGIAGFISEEVAEVAPDAVIYDEPGVPANLDANAMLAYVVGGLQHVHAGGHRRNERLTTLEALVSRIVQFPALAAFLKK